jgi:hypothetical protein
MSLTVAYEPIKDMKCAFLDTLFNLNEEFLEVNHANSADFSDYIQSNYGNQWIIDVLGSKHNLVHIGDIFLSVDKKSAQLVTDNHTTTLRTAGRWQILSIITNFVDYKESHSSLLLIDNDSLVIEEFDPLGYIKENELCSSILQEWCENFYPGYYFLSCRNFCPFKGPQLDGTCWLLCILWIFSRISSDLVSRSDLVLFLINRKNDTTLDALLMRCGFWVIHTLESMRFPEAMTAYTVYSNKFGKLQKSYIQDKKSDLLEELSNQHRNVLELFKSGQFSAMIKQCDA